MLKLFKVARVKLKNIMLIYNQKKNIWNIIILRAIYINFNNNT